MQDPFKDSEHFDVDWQRSGKTKKRANNKPIEKKQKKCG
jgi:hypothetical protein